MANDKKPKKVVHNGKLLDKDEVSVAIISKVSLNEIKLKDLKWLVKLSIQTTLPRSYHNYKIVMEMDEAPFLDRIEELEEQVRGSLFEDEMTTRRDMDKRIAEVKKNLADRKKECERMDFGCTVEELKYKDGNTVITVRVPDDVIEAFNRQKTRLSYYKITLDPVYSVID